MLAVVFVKIASMLLLQTPKNGALRHHRTIGIDLSPLDKIICKLVPRGTELCFIYEAGHTVSIVTPAVFTSPACESNLIRCISN